LGRWELSGRAPEVKLSSETEDNFSDSELTGHNVA
jgi:hypothetical protein